jgi:type 1 glutamine amidotransferase
LFVILRDGRQLPRTVPGRPDLRVLDDPLHGTIRTWMTLEQEQAVVNFVEKGGSFLNLHNSLGLYPPDGPYLKLVGGRYIGHGPYERFRIEVADRAHPITQGVTDFTTADEQHTPVLYDEAAVHLLLRSRMDNGAAVPAGWVREVGAGRICHLASGHPTEPLLNPMYQRLLQNAVEWCLRRR